MIDYQSVVEEMIELLKIDEADHKDGTLMSMAESVQGEICARAHRHQLLMLIEKHTVPE
jgi:hypothetical protein